MYSLQSHLCEDYPFKYDLYRICDLTLELGKETASTLKSLDVGKYPLPSSLKSQNTVLPSFKNHKLNSRCGAVIISQALGYTDGTGVIPAEGQ